MGRPPRAAEGGLVYHALNRANARLAIFHEADNDDAFLRVIACVCWPTVSCPTTSTWSSGHTPTATSPGSCGGLTLTHTQRWHAHRRSADSGHLYQGRFKSFPVQSDEHLLVACRYVERNALRAGLVDRAEAWPWGSLARMSAAPPPLRGRPCPPDRSTGALSRWLDFEDKRHLAGF